ncbi:MAG: EamA family transporter [Lentisphaeria bacterium]|nr:EamA family transporter [Lentisphaeria bacterium]
MWKYYALLSAVFASLTALFAKCGVRGINPNLATAVRTSVILLLTWAIVLFTGAQEQLRALTWKNILFLVLSGLATGLSWLFYFKALQTGEVSRVAPIDKLSVVLVVVFGILFLHEKITWELLTGSTLILAGTLLLLMK